MVAKQQLHIKLTVMAASILAVVMLVLGAGNVLAQNDSEANTANTLRISPVRTDTTADPGETTTVQVTITNPSDDTVTVRAVNNDFIAGDESGTPALILDEDEFAPKRSLKRLMRPIENITIAGGESETVDVEIDVPADAPAGGYFGAIRFAPVAPDDGGQVNLSASVASLILLTVTGDALESIELTDFEVQKDGRSGDFFTEGAGLSAMLRFDNKGDTQLGPIGKISVTRGDEMVYEADFNDKEQRDMVLPDSARRWSVPLDDIGGFGKYTVTGTFTYGSRNQTIEVSQSIWVIPVSVMIAAGVGLLLIIAAIAATTYRFKNRNQSRLSFKRR